LRPGLMPVLTARTGFTRMARGENQVPNAVIIIPARYASTRFPGKALAELWGKPLIQHVYERARQARSSERVIVATDDERIARAARGFGAEVAMTSAEHPSGTDRVAEVARGIEAELIVNVQGDEPLIEPRAIDAAVRPLMADRTIPMGTLCCPVDSVEELANPNVVKVVVDREGFALYFSRLPIPFVRDAGADVRRYRHIGLYAYRREFLLELAGLEPTPLEEAEKLEQLRALEHGHRIKVTRVASAWPGVDTAEELARLEGRGPRGS
jgi:3-deoxy-manno-octulosonate cytidylyltransferase (CMP-KDO synthetase)